MRMSDNTEDYVILEDENYRTETAAYEHLRESGKPALSHPTTTGSESSRFLLL